MRKILLTLIVACVIGLTVPANADYYLAGGFNSWDPAGQLMTDNSDGTFSATVTGLDAGVRYEFKVTDGTWGTAFPGANSWLFADGAGEVEVTFDTNVATDGWEGTQYRIGLNTDPGTWTLVGGFGEATDWNNAAAEMAMASQGGGIYMLSKTLAAGTYEWKAVVTGSWDAISWDGRSVNTSNMTLSLTEDAQVDFYVDALTGVVKTEIIPEPTTMALLGLGAVLAIRRKK